MIILVLRLCNIYAQQPRLFSETLWIWSRSLTHIPTFSDSYVFYPALFQVALFLAEWVLFSFGYLLGLFKSIIEFDTMRLNNLSLFLFLGRFIVMLFSMGTTYLVYEIGKKFKDKNMGIIAMFFLGFNYLYFRESRFLYYNIPVSFFITLAFLFILNIFLYARKRDYILAGLIIGAGTALHYQGIFGLVPLLTAHFLRSDSGSFLKRMASRKLWFSLFLMPLVFIICTPYVIWEFNIFIERLYWQLARLNHIKAVQLVFFPRINGYIDYLSMFLKYDMLISILAFLGIIICVNNKKGILLLSFPIFFYICYGKAAEVHPEWITPVLPFLALLSAYFLIWLFEKIPSILVKQVYCLFISSLVVITPSLINIVKFELSNRIVDIEVVVQSWVSRKLPKDTVLLNNERKLIDDKPILQKIWSVFFTPDFKEPVMDTYKGSTIKISGKVIFPYYNGGIIRISVRSKNYYHGGPPDIASTYIRKPGAYSLFVPIDYGEVILRATYWESVDSKSPQYSSADTPLTINKFDREGVDLIVSSVSNYNH